MLRILVPVDGSDYSLRAVRHVIRLRNRFRQKAEVLLLNVQAPAPMSQLLMDGRLSEVHRLEKPIRERGALQLAAAGAALETAGVAVQPHVEVGEPAAAIARFAETYHCEMIVMGTHGAGAIAAALMGSVAAQVLRLSPLPVLLVP